MTVFWRWIFDMASKYVSNILTFVYSSWWDTWKTKCMVCFPWDLVVIQGGFSAGVSNANNVYKRFMTLVYSPLVKVSVSEPLSLLDLTYFVTINLLLLSFIEFSLSTLVPFYKFCFTENSKKSFWTNDFKDK